jgi:hypothetical protein
MRNGRFCRRFGRTVPACERGLSVESQPAWRTVAYPMAAELVGVPVNELTGAPERICDCLGRHESACHACLIWQNGSQTL